MDTGVDPTLEIAVEGLAVGVSDLKTTTFFSFNFKFALFLPKNVVRNHQQYLVKSHLANDNLTETIANGGNNRLLGRLGRAPRTSLLPENSQTLKVSYF